MNGVLYYTNEDTADIMAVTIVGDNAIQRTVLDGDIDTLSLRNIDIDYTKG